MSVLTDWYSIENPDEVPSPQLIIFPERVRFNIRAAVEMVGDPLRLRPHIKTNKTPEVVQLMLDAGIRKFKFATIEEGALLGAVKAPDALMAYQPAGPRMQQFIDLIQQFPDTAFACLVDDEQVAWSLQDAAQKAGRVIPVYIDLNVGMNRTGIQPVKAFSLYEAIIRMDRLVVKGLHAYDGHIRDLDMEVRRKRCDDAFTQVEAVKQQIVEAGFPAPVVIAGGSPSFSVHAGRTDVECSPGTFVYWDKGYGDICREQPFVHAALVVARVLSVPESGKATLDMGHKAIAAENDITRRVSFLNAPEVQLISQSEEHGVVELPAGMGVKPGDVLYALPYHVCPTVNLYSRVYIVENHQARSGWSVAARH